MQKFSFKEVGIWNVVCEVAAIFVRFIVLICDNVSDQLLKIISSSHMSYRNYVASDYQWKLTKIITCIVLCGLYHVSIP